MLEDFITCMYEKNKNCICRAKHKGEVTDKCVALADCNFKNPDGSKRVCPFYKVEKPTQYAVVNLKTKEIVRYLDEDEAA